MMSRRHVYSGPPWALALTHLLTFLLWWLLSLEERRVMQMSYLWPRIHSLHSHTVSSLWPGVGLWVDSYQLLHKQTSLTRSESCTHLWVYKFRRQLDAINLAKIIIVTWPLEHVGSRTMDPWPNLQCQICVSSCGVGLKCNRKCLYPQACLSRPVLIGDQRIHS